VLYGSETGNAEEQAKNLMQVDVLSGVARCVVAWDGEIWRTAWLSLDNIHIYMIIYNIYDYIYIDLSSYNLK
jgi:hypothetical protein